MNMNVPYLPAQPHPNQPAATAVLRCPSVVGERPEEGRFNTEWKEDEKQFASDVDTVRLWLPMIRVYISLID